jgi:hypothetical protein
MAKNLMTNDDAVTRSKRFIAIFGTFERFVTNLRGTFVEKVKKSIINPPYCRSVVGSQYGATTEAGESLIAQIDSQSKHTAPI